MRRHPGRCASPRIRVRVPPGQRGRVLPRSVPTFDPGRRRREIVPAKRNARKGGGDRMLAERGGTRLCHERKLKKGERRRKREAEKRTDNCQHKGGEGSSLLFTRRSSARDSISHTSASSFSDILVFYVIYIVRGALGRV